MRRFKKIKYTEGAFALVYTDDTGEGGRVYTIEGKGEALCERQTA